MNVSRRAMLRALSVGLCSWPAARWAPALASAASAAPSRSKSVIILWLNGGPATIDLWDLKPGHENGGPFKEIATSVPGMQISEHLPKLAAIGSEFSIVRSMSTREGDHARARFVSNTGYTPQGAIAFPAVGSLVAHEFEDASRDIPSYVHIGGRPRIVNGGFLGPKYAPFVVGGGGRRGPAGPAPAELKVADLAPSDEITDRRQAMRLELASELRSLSAVSGGSPVVDALDSANERALRLMRPEAASAFDLHEEDEALRTAYGAGAFGQGCLMARRLVERGVSFVEVALDGWDTHANNFERVKELSLQLDAGFAALLADLKQRGLLGSTLVVCQGEFGRTPKINGQAGRDHWPSSWSAVLAGAGIRGGQVVGGTSQDGVTVESKPTRTADLMATVFKSIGLDPMKQNMSNVSRPIRLANPDGKPIEELL